ncbi:MAG: hypothetical protein OK452_02340 [Thaumarchaeota archaeon]|nr:hypothetical protein [Nitrososphaerota archaeon]
MREITIDRLVRIYILITAVNLAVAVGFTLPVLVPEFTFPLILTIWPGTWMFFAYFAFLIAGVLAPLGWALIWDLSKKYYQKVAVSKYLAMASIYLTLVGVYGQSSLMFALGYTGGYAALVGVGKSIITRGLIGWMVVPIGVFIYLYLLGTVAGIAGLALSKRSAANAGQSV